MPSALNSSDSQSMSGLRGKQGGLTKYYPSPNELERLMKEEKEKRRKMRIVQVREQAKHNAAKIRHDVKNEYNKQVLLLAKKLQNEMDEEKTEKMNTLEEMYLENMSRVGQAHRDAAVQGSQVDSRSFQKWENESRARQRHQKALVKLHAETAEQERLEKQRIFARQAALEQEKARAFEIASRPPPPPDPVSQLKPSKVGPVKVSHAGAYSSTHFHMQDPCVVERAESPEQVDAKAVAKEQQVNYEEFEKDRKRDLHEQREKAQLRHKHALQKEILKQDYNHLLHELSDLQRADAHRRSHVVAAIPRQIYQPPHRRLQEQAERQVDMERDFEDAFLAGTNYDGDLSLCLDPRPAPPTPAATESLDLSSTTLIEEPAEETLQSGPPPPPSPPCHLQHLTEESARNAVTRVEASTGTDAKEVSETMSEKLKSTDVSLKRLLERIQKQRDNWQQSTEQHLDAISPRLTEPPPPSTLTPRDDFNDAASSTNGGRTLTQYSCTSSDLLAPHVAPPSETSESTAHESLSQRTITSAESLSLRGCSGALLHPMEEAARTRHNNVAENRLAVEKQRQDALKQEQDGIQQEIFLQQRELMELNNKIAQGRQKLLASESHQVALQQNYEVSPSQGTDVSLSQHTISDFSVDTNSTPPFMRAQVQTQRIQKYLNELFLKGNSIAAQNPRVSEYVNRALSKDSTSISSVISEKLHDPYLAELDATINELDQEQSRLSQPMENHRLLNASVIVPAVPINSVQRERSAVRSFKVAESHLEEQLREAEKQKEEIMARNQKHLEEIQRLKEKWDREKQATQRLHEIIDQNVTKEEEKVKEEGKAVVTPADRPSIDDDVRTAVSLFEDVSFNSGRWDTRGQTMGSSELKSLSKDLVATDLSLTENPAVPKVTSSVDFYDLGYRPTQQALVIDKSEENSTVHHPEIAPDELLSAVPNIAPNDPNAAPTWFDVLKKPTDAAPSPRMLFKELELHDISENDLMGPMTRPAVSNNSRLSSTPKSINLNNNNRDLSCTSSFHFNTSDGAGSKQPLQSLDQCQSPDTARDSTGSAGLSQHSIGAPSDSDASFPDRRAIMEMLRKVTQRIDRQEELLDVLQRIEKEGSDLADEEKAELQQLVSDRLSSLGNGSGIIEEPDITLVSLNSTLNQGEESCVMSHQQNSLLSFEDHEHSLSSNQSPAHSPLNQQWHVLPAEPVSEGSTPERAAQNAQWLIDINSTSGRVEAISEENLSEKDLTSIAVTQIRGGSEISDDIAGLSLQEAFSRKRERFIKTQGERHEAAKEKLRKQMKDSAVEGHRGAMVKSISQWKKKKLLPQKDAPRCTRVVETHSDDRKKAEKEARARTERLYNRLDEVKESKKITDRQATYAANRQKAKLYHLKHRELTKKKKSKS